ncbi:MAG: hypothetical protein HOC23_17430 [Halieaceae bacterium]|jgi:hypothetical protein|nr:hypothetical protein [Halieaceae bacterium]
MLSLSADLSDATVNLQMINGDLAAAEGDLAHAEALMKFAESFARRDEQALSAARDALARQASPEILVDAAAVAANFQRMVRIADSTGIPLDTRNAAISVDIRKELQLERFGSSKNTPPPGWKIKLLGLIARPLAKRKLKQMQQTTQDSIG